MPQHEQPLAAPVVLLALPGHHLLPLGWQLSTDQLAPSKCGDFSMLHMPDQFQSNLTYCLLVLAHMLPQFTLCSFGSHELVSTSGIGLLPEVRVS